MADYLLSGRPPASVMRPQFARAGVDIVITGDDVATQNGLMMRIEMWREYLKPLQTATARAVKEANPDCYVFYHCDGNVAAVDPRPDRDRRRDPQSAPARVRGPGGDQAEIRHRLSFWGTVSVQRTMAFGTPDEVRRRGPPADPRRRPGRRADPGPGTRAGAGGAVGERRRPSSRPPIRSRFPSKHPQKGREIGPRSTYNPGKKASS